MQFAKDSFYLALRDRLAALNPARTIVVQGRMRPAVLVDENEPAQPAPPLPNAFHLVWGIPEFVIGAEAARRPLMKIGCRISYSAATEKSGAVDRGRALTALDAELLRLLAPPRTPKCDHTHTPAVALGTMVFWGLPEFVAPPLSGPGSAGQGGDFPASSGEVTRTARLIIFFFPEVDQA